MTTLKHPRRLRILRPLFESRSFGKIIETCVSRLSIRGEFIGPNSKTTPTPSKEPMPGESMRKSLKSLGFDVLPDDGTGYLTGAACSERIKLAERSGATYGRHPG
jgi:hypothetical protein